MGEKVIELTPSQERMVRSDKTIVVLIGPKGEGKTVGAIASILYHAQCFPYKIRGAIIRDRFTSIQGNTIPSIMKVAGEILTFHRDGTLMKGPNLEVDLFGVDDLADINRLQGSEYYFVWIEEPAPFFDVGSTGIREEVFDICGARGGREEGAIDKVFITMNPASKSHWTYKRFILRPTEDFEIIRIPYGENPFLPAKERQKTIDFFKNRPDFFQRYVKGEFASIHIGEAVTPEFSELLHRSKIPLVPLDGLTFRFWDGGLNPTCVFVQVTANGQVRVQRTLRGENIGMRQLIQQEVKPFMVEYLHKIKEWRDIGDPSLWARDESDSTNCPAQIIEDELDTVYEDGEMTWEGRRETMKEIFRMTVDGEPKLLINCEDDIMTEALGGGWHYNKNSAGVVMANKPVKDKHSHPGDALSHGLAKLIHPEKFGKPRKRQEQYMILDDPFSEGNRPARGSYRYKDFDPFSEGQTWN